MRALVFSACLSLLALHPAAATVPGNPDEVLLERLSVQWMAALERKDRKALEAFLADDYVLQMPGDSASQYVHRDEWLANAISMDWTNFRYENVVARVHGDHATVSSRLYFKVSPNPFTFDSGVIDLWERRDGRWQVTNRYLGESAMKERLAFLLGLLAAGLAAGAAYLAARLFRRTRRPVHN